MPIFGVYRLGKSSLEEGEDISCSPDTNELKMLERKKLERDCLNCTPSDPDPLDSRNVLKRLLDHQTSDNDRAAFTEFLSYLADNKSED